MTSSNNNSAFSSSSVTSVVTKRNPREKRAAMLAIYNKVALSFGREPIGNVMNFGYVNVESSHPFPTPQEQSMYGPRFRMYREVCHQGHDNDNNKGMSLDLKGKDILEVGCGRGGGAAFVAQTFSPQSMVGLDFCQPAIALAQQNYSHHPNLRFVTGDALSLPFPDASFDAVINVESSHCYTDMAAFCRQVFRVLRPGGWFCLTDIRPVPAWPATMQTLQTAGFVLLHQEDISQHVARSMEMFHEDTVAFIDHKNKAAFPPGALHEFMGSKTSQSYQRLLNGKSAYMRFVLQKPTTAKNTTNDDNDARHRHEQQLRELLRTIDDPWSKGLMQHLQINKIESTITNGTSSSSRHIATLHVDTSLANPTGHLHGGAIATTIDVLTTVAMFAAEPRLTLTLDLHVTCMAAAAVGSTVVVEAQVQHVGRSVVFASCELWNDKTNNSGKTTNNNVDGNQRRVLVATGSHTKKIVGKKIHLDTEENAEARPPRPVSKPLSRL